MLHDQHEAEDMTQNVFIQVFSQNYNQIDNLKSWIVTISMNMCRNHLKRKNKIVLIEDTAQYNSRTLDNIDEEYVKKQFREDMLELLSELPERTKSVIILKYLHDMRNLEIATLLGISEGTVKASCHYGLKLLRGKLTNNLKFKEIIQ